LSQFNYFGPRNFGVSASYYSETLLYSNFRGPLFSRTCQARKIREIKGTQKNGFYSSFITICISALQAGTSELFTLFSVHDQCKQSARWGWRLVTMLYTWHVKTR